MSKAGPFWTEIPWKEIWKTISLIKGTPVGRAGLLCLVAGIGSLTGFWQYVVVGILDRLDVKVVLPDVPIWLNVLIGLFLTILGVWLLVWNVRQGTKQRPDPTPHDVDLYSKFRALITDNDIDFFRTHDFGNSFRYDRTPSIDELVVGWRGGRHSFNDTEVEAALEVVKNSAAELSAEIVAKTYPVMANMDLATVMRENYGDFDVPMDIYETIRKLNELSAAFVASVDSFERIATGRLARP